MISWQRSGFYLNYQLKDIVNKLIRHIPASFGHKETIAIPVSSAVTSCH